MAIISCGVVKALGEWACWRRCQRELANCLTISLWWQLSLSLSNPPEWVCENWGRVRGRRGRMEWGNRSSLSLSLASLPEWACCEGLHWLLCLGGLNAECNDVPNSVKLRSLVGDARPLDLKVYHWGWCRAAANPTGMSDCCAYPLVASGDVRLAHLYVRCHWKFLRLLHAAIGSLGDKFWQRGSVDHSVGTK